MNTTQKIRKELEDFFKKGGFNFKTNIYVRHYFMRLDVEKKIMSGCIYFDFFVKGKLYVAGCMADITLNRDLTEIETIERNGVPFFEDKSIVSLKDEDLNYIEEKYLIPILKTLIDSGDIPYFKERVYNSIEEDFFEPEIIKD